MNKNIAIIAGVILIGSLSFFLLRGDNSTDIGQNPESANETMQERAQVETLQNSNSTLSSEPSPVTEQATVSPEETQPQEQTPSTKASYTMAEVAVHSNASSCYTVVRGNVYDVTPWIPKHPGGPQRILQMCGKDATASFEGQHGGKGGPEAQLAGFKIGVLAN